MVVPGGDLSHRARRAILLPMHESTHVDPATVANEDLSVELCGPADRPEQARLFNACFKKALGPEALRWRYDQSPHGTSVSVVARPPGGEAISGYACNPRRALAGGDEATFATIGQTGDVMTHPDWRKRGIFSSLDAEALRETARRGWPLVFGLPNRRSAPTFLKLGWSAVGTLRPWSFYASAGGAARAVRRREGRGRAALLPLARLRCAAGLRRLRRAARGLTVAPLERFPDAVLPLARAVEERFALMVRRDADYLNWRFVDTTAGLHRALGVYRPGGSLAGYAVVQRPREGERVGYLVDALAPEPAALAAAVGAALELLAAAGASVVQATAVDGSFWQRTLEGAGFLAPKPQNHLIVIAYLHRPEHPLARAAVRAADWYLTDGDRDDETMG